MKMYMSFVKKYVLFNKFNIFFIIFILFIQNIPVLLVPIFYKKIIDVYLPAKNIRYTLYFLGLILIMNISKLVLNILKDYNSAQITENIGKRIRIELIEKINFLPYEYFDKNNISNFLSKYDNEVSTIMIDLGDMLVRLVGSLITIIMTSYMIIYLSGKYLAMFVLVFFLFFYTSLYFGKKVAKRAEEFFTKNSSSLSIISDNYRNIYITKLYKGYQFATKRFNDTYEDQFNSRIKLEIMHSLNVNISGFWIFILTFAAWGIGVNDILEGVLTIGGLIAIIDYLNMLMSPMNFVPQFVGSYKESLIAIDRIKTFLEQPDEENNLTENKSKNIVVDKILVNNLSFGYNDTDVIKNLDLKFVKGKIYGLLGKSGCGKSTFIKLLMGFYEPTNGEIVLECGDERFEPVQARDFIGYVPQESTFFEDTIYNNLSFGSNIERELIYSMSKKVDIYDELINLKDGIDTQINYENSNLSGGQKRRLDFLRILIRSKNVIICDELTSFLDEARKKVFYKTLNEIKKDKIIIVITHNSDELSYLDEIYNLEHLN